MTLTTTKKENPILFSSAMVRAILDGRKTQTRRIVKDQPSERECVRYDTITGEVVYEKDESSRIIPPAHGQPGDRLWVKETFRLANKTQSEPDVVYRADDPEVWGAPWKPSIFMPRKFSRITLEIESVRVERLHEISRQDAMAEGIYLNENDYWTAGEMEPGKVLRGLESLELAYGRLWDYINGPGSWDKNPWVWVIQFRRLKP